MDRIIPSDALVLVTGASGFIGPCVLESLLRQGLTRIRCFTRQSSNVKGIEQLRDKFLGKATVEIVSGNLLSRADCARAVENVAVIYHLAAGTGQKSIPHGYLNSVVTTRNLIEASLDTGCLKRFVSISSFAVYTNANKPNGRLLDESCPIEMNPTLRGDAYSFSKVKQDLLIMDYGKKRNLPFVLLRPGVVYGPGKTAITGRVGLDTFGVFLHLGGGNRIPFTFVDNCADAIALAGLVKGVDGEVFNIVDDDLPTSRQFLGLYKRHVKTFRSIFLPKFVSYLLCWAWEAYSDWSKDQLPRAYNRRMWQAFWSPTKYSNQKLKDRLGWTPQVSTAGGLQKYFAACAERKAHA